MRVAAVIAALLLVPLSAFASGTHDHSPVASESSSAHEHDADRPLHQPDCTIAGSGQDLFCCHFASPSPEATGPLRSLNDDQPVLAANLATLAARKIGIQPTILSATTFITGPPRFILFGNFRS
jgi:hypothetical protein